MGSCRGSTRPSELNRIVKIISREVAAAQEGDPFHPSDETDRLLRCVKTREDRGGEANDQLYSNSEAIFQTEKWL